MSKEQGIRRERFDELLAECIQMWDEFDPIGVYDGDNDWPKGEYDSYARQSVSLMHSGADLYKLKAFVRSVVHVTMGLPDTPDKAIDAFAEKLRTLDVE